MVYRTDSSPDVVGKSKPSVAGLRGGFGKLRATEVFPLDVRTPECGAIHFSVPSPSGSRQGIRFGRRPRLSFRLPANALTVSGHPDH